MATEIYLSGEAKTVHQNCWFLTINGSVLSMTVRDDGHATHQILSGINNFMVAVFLAAECPSYFFISNLSFNMWNVSYLNQLIKDTLSFIINLLCKLDKSLTLSDSRFTHTD